MAGRPGPGAPGPNPKRHQPTTRSLKRRTPDGAPASNPKARRLEAPKPKHKLKRKNARGTRATTKRGRDDRRRQRRRTTKRRARKTSCLRLKATTEAMLPQKRKWAQRRPTPTQDGPNLRPVNNSEGPIRVEGESESPPSARERLEALRRCVRDREGAARDAGARGEAPNPH